MRTRLVATLLLLAAPLALPAPASADATCREGEPDCPPGMLVCTYRPQVCVPDPCDDTACRHPATPENHVVCAALPECPFGSWVCGVRPHVCVPDLDAPFCVTVYDFPDLGYRVCVTATDPACRIYEERTTIAGTERRCIYPGEGGSA